MHDATYSLPVGSREAFNKLLTKVNKRAEKLGVPLLTAEFLGEHQVEVVTRSGRRTGRFSTEFRVRLTGATVKFDGWRLIGVVSPLTGDDGKLYPIITTVPGEHTTGTHNDPLFCDHCKARRDRKETFIVAHDDGREAQVGRTCLGDFLGSAANSPDGVAQLIGARNEFSNDVESLARGPRTFSANSLATVLAATIACIRKHGWTPVSEARRTGKTATKVHVAGLIDAIESQPDIEDNDDGLAMALWTKRFENVLPLPTEADYAEANVVHDFLRVWLDKQEDLGKMNDYLQTARTVLSVYTVNAAAFGITCSLIALARREQDKWAGKAAPAPAPVSKHLGTEGQRMDATVLYDGAYTTIRGTGEEMAIVSLKTLSGDVLRWFTSPNQVPTLTIGQQVNVRCTVRRHDTYKGIAQTIINRPVFTP